MECIYSEEVQKDTDQLEISGDEAKHLHVLRLNTGDRIEISNGKGLIATTVIQSINSKKYLCRVEKIEQFKSELPFRLDLAFGILSDRNRLEFLIEKATELGVQNFFPLITQFAQKKTVNQNRLEQKALAAMKQCKRSILPAVHKAGKFSDLNKEFEYYDSIILSDVEGNAIESLDIKGNCLVIIGPEGGFSQEEIDEIKNHRPLILSLGNRRLRTETAAIISVGLISLKKC